MKDIATSPGQVGRECRRPRRPSRKLSQVERKVAGAKNCCISMFDRLVTYQKGSRSGSGYTRARIPDSEQVLLTNAVLASFRQPPGRTLGGGSSSGVTGPILGRMPMH